jgi:arginase family enzyme
MQKPLLFVKIKSRLGLINPPNREVNPNIGVEEGPEYVLDNEFISKFSDSEVLNYEFSKPEIVKKVEYFEILANEYAELISRISEKLNPNKILVCAGGDHSVAFASIASILKLHNPKKTAVIMIDSHGDIHQISTSPSGNFHGMWLRPMIDVFEIELIDKLVPNKMPNANLLYIGIYWEFGY